jgi:hypothetical protein
MNLDKFKTVDNLAKQWRPENGAIQNQVINRPQSNNYLNRLRLNLYKRQSESIQNNSSLVKDDSNHSRNKRSSENDPENQNSEEDSENVEQIKRFDNTVVADKVFNTSESILVENKSNVQNYSIHTETFFQKASNISGPTSRWNDSKNYLTTASTTTLEQTSSFMKSTQSEPNTSSKIKTERAISNSITPREYDLFNSIMSSDSEKTIYESFDELVDNHVNKEPVKICSFEMKKGPYEKSPI